MRVDAGHDGTTVELAVGERLEIVLKENATAGYRWSVVTDGGPALALQQDSVERSSDAPGAAGARMWRFAATSPGTVAVGLEYRRSWEKAPLRTFELQVHVRR